LFKHILWILVIVSGCMEKSADKKSNRKENELFTIRSFNALSNVTTDSVYLMELDYHGVVKTGFVIPSARQSKESCFTPRFEIRNNSNLPRKFCYKIFYQNDSYKFNDTDNTGKAHPLSGENFY